MKVRIREVREEDIPRICEIEEKTFKKDAYPSFYLRLLALLHRETFLVAESGNRIVGYAVISIERGKTGHLISIAVHPDYRRRGIGASLLSSLESQLDSLGIRRVYLEVRKSNSAAIRLYEKLGFEVIGELRGYYSDGEDAIIMSKNL